MPANYLPFLIIALALGSLFLGVRRSFARAGQVKSFLQQGAKVIDVRTPEEYASGHLPGALNIPYNDLRAQIPRQFPNQDQPLLLHCLSGVRSAMGKRTLQSLGYTRVLNLGSYARAQKLLHANPKL
jgi:rhodanese-related sulfurtransferase